MVIDSYNAHRLMFALFVIASKLMVDEHFSNSVYAKIGGMSPKEIMRYEMDVMQALSFNLAISEKEFAELSDECNRE